MRPASRRTGGDLRRFYFGELGKGEYTAEKTGAGEPQTGVETTTPVMEAAETEN